MPRWVLKKALVATLVAAWRGGSRLVIQSHVGNLAISRLTRAATGLQIQNCPVKQPTISRRFRRDCWRAILSKFDHDWKLKQLCSYLRTKTPYQLRSGENCVALCRHATSQLLMNQKKIVISVRRIDPNQWMVKVRMFRWKFKALILNATISSHWWWKWYKGHLRMNLKVNSIVKESEYHYSQYTLCHHLWLRP